MTRTRPAGSLPLAFLVAATIVSACGDSQTSAAGTSTDPGSEAVPDTQTQACTPATEADYAAFQAKVGPVTQDNCSKQMVTTYTEAGFDAVTNLIVQASLDPNNVPLIGSSFQDKLAGATDARKAQFTTHLSKFLQTVYGASDVYPADAPSMPAAHKPLNVTFDQYLNFATKVVVPALKAAGVTADHIDKCFVPPVLADATVRSMVFCK